MNKTNRRTYILLNLMAILMLASVITGRLFHFPNYDQTGESTMMVMAFMWMTISTLYWSEKSEDN